MRRAVSSIALGLFAVLVAAAVAAWWGYDRYTRAGPSAEPVTVIVPKGSGVDAIASLLRDSGVIGSPRLFSLAMRLTRQDQSLRAGEYAFPARVAMRDAARMMLNGDTVKRRLTVAEGLTTKQIYALVEATEGLSGDMPAPAGEGALLPETYFFSHGDSRASVIERMRAAMKEAVARLWRDRVKDSVIKTRREAVTLASIIEKETGLPKERPTVAAVFHNRLKRGMRLQSDPTVVYALTNGDGPLPRELTLDDLAVDSPYNTYKVAGLPPGPIANPGLASLEAALSPADSDFLYFVADGNGGHVFARTLDEHNRNVARWRKIKRSRADDG